ncbi:HNH endonuclease [Gottfriedia solisilvae]|uniref:HNH domain-containing protein n=1 Tax=Gottfriedia solisilvae TaxID=1516104 RepID=A0A8J3AE19_9BACI|nr:hypothetical protein [Gottfriedia solisilvae]GGI12583.1 hypothetical protein GCM10007380_13640 [Gottfriedia solisilvae]
MSQLLLVEEIDEIKKNITQFNQDIVSNDNLRKKLAQFAQWYYIEQLDMFAPSKYIGYKDMTAEVYLESDFLEYADGRSTEHKLDKWFVKKDIPSLLDKLRRTLGLYGRIRVNAEVHILKSEIYSFEDEILYNYGIFYENDEDRVGVPAIRVLPMSSQDPAFANKSIIETQEWFLYNLPNRHYQYKNGLNTPSGSLFLFQYQSHIIAAAKLLHKERYEQVADGGYKGYYLFNPSTICIFNPLTIDDMKLIWDGIGPLKNAQHNLNKDKYEDFMNLIYSKDIRFALDNDMDEETFQSEVERVVIIDTEPIVDEPKEKYNSSSTTTCKSNRNRTVSKRAIKVANYLCEVSDSHKFFISKGTGENYVEAHHLIPMEFEEEFEHNLDVEANVTSLCPLCHKKIHHATYEEITQIITPLYEERKERLRRCGLNISLEQLLEYYK